MDQRVFIDPDPRADGQVAVAGIAGLFDAGRIAAAFTRVDDIARRLRREGDSRTLTQLRSDIGLDLLIDGQITPEGRPSASCPASSAPSTSPSPGPRSTWPPAR